MHRVVAYGMSMNYVLTKNRKWGVEGMWPPALFTEKEAKICVSNLRGVKLRVAIVPEKEPSFRYNGKAVIVE